MKNKLHSNVFSTSRRRVLRAGFSAAAAGMAPMILPGSVLGLGQEVAPSNRLVMGAIGVGGQGSGDLLGFLAEKDVHMVAVCDVRKDRRLAAKQRVDGHYGNGDCAAYTDFRELLARPDIQAVMIATGDRWHALASILAMRAGKDVYCEKPAALTIAEARALEATAAATKRIFQTGAQRASEANYILAGELVRLGRLGEPKTVHAHLGYLPDWPRRNHMLPDQPDPARDEVDWEMWLGPCPRREFHPAYLGTYPAPGWYGQYDFAGGIPQWGSHTILQCQLDLGLGATSAVAYEYSPDIKGKGMNIQFANGLRLIARCDGWQGSCGVRYEGSEGWVSTADGYAKPDVSSPALLEGAKSLLDEYLEKNNRARGHIRDFLQCVRSRRPTVTDAAVASHTMITNLAMDICLDLKRDLQWDPERAEFKGDDEANALRARPTREPWAKDLA